MHRVASNAGATPAAIAVVLAFTLAAPAHASAFIGGTVETSSASPPGTPLNARTQPKPSAPVWLALPNTGTISLTGPCRRYNAAYTAVVASFNLQTTVKTIAQPKMVLSRTWCAVWVEKPSGSFSQRWVSAKYVSLI